MVVELRNILNEVKTIPPSEIEARKLFLLAQIAENQQTLISMLAEIFDMEVDTSNEPPDQL